MANEYLNFWNIPYPAFARAIESHEFYTPRSFAPILDRLSIHCEQGQVALVTSDSGHGKSSLALWLYDQIPTTSHDALIMAMTQNESSPGWLMPRLASFFGIGNDSELTQTQMALRALERLEELADENRRLVVIIDASDHIREAQALDELNLILNLQSLSSPCVSFVLLATPEIADLLASSQRVSHRLSCSVRLPTLDWEETFEYLLQRLIRLKLPANEIVDREMSHLVCHLTGGNFNRINALMESTMIEGYLRQTTALSTDLVRIAAESMMVASIDDYQPLPEPAIELATSDHPVEEAGKDQVNEMVSGDPVGKTKRQLRTKRSGKKRALSLVPLETLFSDEDPKS